MPAARTTARTRWQFAIPVLLTSGSAAWYHYGHQALPGTFRLLDQHDVRLLGAIPLLLMAVVAQTFILVTIYLDRSPTSLTLDPVDDVESAPSDPDALDARDESPAAPHGECDHDDIIDTLRQAAMEEAHRAADERVRADAAEADRDRWANAHAALLDGTSPEAHRLHAVIAAEAAADTRRQLDALDTAHTRVVTSLQAQVVAAQQQVREAETARAAAETSLAALTAQHYASEAAAVAEAVAAERNLFTITLDAITEATVLDLGDRTAHFIESHTDRVKAALGRLTTNPGHAPGFPGLPAPLPAAETPPVSPDTAHPAEADLADLRGINPRTRRRRARR